MLRRLLALIVIFTLIATPLVLGGHTQAAAACAPGTERIPGTDLCTHGPDPAPPGLDVHRPVDLLPRREAREAITAEVCSGDGESGMRVQAMYVRGQSTASRYAEALPNIQLMLSEIDGILNDHAQQTGGERHVRWVHDASCVPIVPEVVISNQGAQSFNTNVTDVMAQGYDRTDRVYMMFVDYDQQCGIATLRIDDSPGDTNRSNTGPAYGRSDNGCWRADVAMHEMWHNIGAVQYSAPHSSGGGHCTDEYDLMCYSDSPYFPEMQYICGTAFDDRTTLDCNHDDYFNVNPPSGSYLDTHWNTARSVFLKGASTDPTPEPTVEPTTTPEPTPRPCHGKSKKHPCPTPAADEEVAE